MEGRDLRLGDSDGWEPLDNPRTHSFERRLPPLWVRARPDMQAEMRFQPDQDCTNVMGGLHGGFLSAAAEQSLFLPLYLHGRVERGGIVVIDLNLSFLAGGQVDRPIVAHIELLRETGRMAFLRGSFSQDGMRFTAYSGTVRKLPRAA